MELAGLVSMAAALYAGVAASLQGAANAALARYISLWPTILVVHVVGLATTAAVLLTGVPRAQWSGIGAAPWYVFIGGALGATIVAGMTWAIGRVGIAAATTALLVGQMAVAMLADHFGLFGLSRIPITPVRLMGIVLLLIGMRLMFK